MSNQWVHGAADLALVRVDTYNEELRDAEGFIGDRASARAFSAILAEEREQASTDPPRSGGFLEDSNPEALDDTLMVGDVEAAGVILGTIEEFAQEFAAVIQRFLRLKTWDRTERIVIGGGLRASRVGELAIGRTGAILRSTQHRIELVPIRHDPDEAGLLGCVELAAPPTLGDHQGILAVDIGGSNFRAGIVRLHRDPSTKGSKPSIWASDQWCHADDRPDRSGAVERLIHMLQMLIQRADRGGLNLAPFVGIGCPGLIRSDGSIAKGGQNLPGDWQQDGFNLPELVQRAIPRVGDRAVTVALHNDAVVQGLSEAPFMRDVERWGVMTMGTGLGNARFTNRATPW